MTEETESCCYTVQACLDLGLDVREGASPHVSPLLPWHELWIWAGSPFVSSNRLPVLLTATACLIQVQWAKSHLGTSGDESFLFFFLVFQKPQQMSLPVSLALMELAEPITETKRNSYPNRFKPVRIHP